MHKQIKQNPQTNQMKPKQTQKKSNRTNRKTHSLCGFRFGRKRELERLKRKIRVERNKLEVAKRVREEKLVSYG